MTCILQSAWDASVIQTDKIPILMGFASSYPSFGVLGTRVMLLATMLCCFPQPQFPQNNFQISKIIHLSFTA